jgi:very-short-patch-repair endonuclease
MRAASKAWTDQLIDLGGRNTLLHYRDLRQGTLDLADGEPVAVDSLLAGHTVRLSNLFPGPALPAAARRARTVRAKANENFEERGLQTLFLGWGMATWTNQRGDATPAAPVLLRPADLTPRGRAAEEFDLALRGEWELNPTLLHLLATDHQVTLPTEALIETLGDETGAGPDPGSLFDGVAKAAVEALPDFSIDGRVVLGNFSYAKLPMVRDIEAAEEVLLGSDILMAIAGDEAARAALRARRPDVALDGPDLVAPSDEFVVLDADASQSYVINAAVAGGDLVVEGPPGTGKSQTIANLIATLAARGERVLFVAEKRAAIDAVLDRLHRAGLGDLVMDLHDATLSKRRLAGDLSKALADASTTPLPRLEAAHERLVARRGVLRARVQALHAPRDPWGVSVYEVQARLTAIPPAVRTSWRLRGEALQALDAAAFAASREDLRELAGLGGLTLTDASPWARAARGGTITTGEQAQAAFGAASELLIDVLPASRAVLQAAAVDCGLPEPARIGEWKAILALLVDVARLLDDFDPDLYRMPLGALAEALEPAVAGRWARFVHQLTDRGYREAKEQMQALTTKELTPAQLRLAAVDAAKQLAAWRALTGDDRTFPHLPTDRHSMGGAIVQLEAAVQALDAWVHRGDLGQMSAERLAEFTTALIADRATLAKVPGLFRHRSNLLQRGLGPLLDEVQSRGLPVDAALLCLDHAWLSSVLEAVEVTDPVVGAFDGEAHRSTVDDFREADVAHIGTSALRVRRAVAERITAVRDEFPLESDVIERQARLKRRHLPLRQLFQQAPNVLGALKPCWAMSPLVVAQLLPPERCFDVVVFDEASQVTPADAVGALMRADRAVVAGDPHQLPPTSFFATSGGGEDDERAEAEEGPEALTTDMESVLDVMATLLPRPLGTRTLAWHYRSEDERLIAFSNAQANLYDWSLTTFPGVLGHESLRHELVPFVAGRAGEEESVADEVTRVVDLVRDHARRRPDESLGVIAMGIKHANRITEALRQARIADDTLNAFCDEAAAEPLFVKNLERVQGDERDAVILSIGYGKHADGRMRYFFGPLNQAGGERRLNVAITRARRRMTVVSSFSAAEMDPTRLRAEGAQMLARYLHYAESSGADLGSVSKPKPALDPFEADVRDQLEAAGLPLTVQHGCSADWIDFAAGHPTRPGEMVLAIECDGPGYRASATARDRDRLRQEHLERLGWRFHRIWSTDWFHHRDAEIARAADAYLDAVRHADEVAARSIPDGDEAGPPRAEPADAPPVTDAGAADPGAAAVDPPNDADGADPAESGNADRDRAVAEPPALDLTDADATAPDRDPRPAVDPGRRIADYRPEELVAVVRWIESDTLLRTEEELVAEVMRELGFGRKGSRITATITDAIREARTGSRADAEPS